MRVMHIKLHPDNTLIHDEENDEVLLTNVHSIMYDRMSAVAKKVITEDKSGSEALGFVKNRQVKAHYKKLHSPRQQQSSVTVIEYLNSLSHPQELSLLGSTHGANILTSIGKKIQKDVGAPYGTITMVLSILARRRPHLVGKKCRGVYIIKGTITTTEFFNAQRNLPEER